MLARICQAVAIGLLVATTPSAAWSCAPPPDLPRDLDLPRFYADRSGETIDPKQLEHLRAKTRQLVDALRTATRLADRAWQGRTAADQRQAAACAIRALEAFAQSGAYLGHTATKQAEYQRNWDNAGYALAAIKLKRTATQQQRETIAAWLTEMAERSHTAFSKPGRKRNNHWYWLGLATAATAIFADDTTLWQRARSIYDDALRDIASDGTLPLELARGKRALDYHVFALMPIVMMAELATLRGEDWYVRGDGALHRLAAVTLAGEREPALFDRRAGVPQVRPVNMRAGWTFLYGRRFARRVIPSLMRKRHHRWLGGDVRVLIAAMQEWR